MNRQSTTGLVLALCIAASLAWTTPSPKAGADCAPLPTPAVTLSWTVDTQAYTGGDWNGAVTAAANHVEQGYSDWRLPTEQELQGALQIPAGQAGSWGLDTRNPDGQGHGWTSRSQGQRAFAVTIAKSGSFVIASQSGATDKFLKGSNFNCTKFVRP